MDVIPCLRRWNLSATGTLICEAVWEGKDHAVRSRQLEQFILHELGRRQLRPARRRSRCWTSYDALTDRTLVEVTLTYETEPTYGATT